MDVIGGRHPQLTVAKSDRGWISGVAGEGIVTIGDPRLKQPAARVEDIADVAELLVSMVDRLRSLNGAGLAAPQIGASVRVVIIEVRKTDVFPDRPAHPLVQMINPTIVARSGTKVIDWEGCFSVPGLMGHVPRSDHVTVSYTTEGGVDTTADFVDYAARVVQHEIDHLDGVEFVDRMDSMATLTTVQNYLTFHRPNSG